MIPIGTVLLNPDREVVSGLRSLVAEGFESFQIAFKNTLGATELPRLADEVAAALDGAPAVVSSLGIYGNSLAATPHGDEVRSILSAMIDAAPRFGTDLVCCFAGRVTGASIPESIPRFREIFSTVATKAEDRGIRIAFENCLQGGTWWTGDRNIAHNPAAWELMFEAVPSPALGLEWEPAHQLGQLIDPIAQLRRWAGRVFHVHGKDGEVRREVLARSGCLGSERFCFHRFPGLGDSNWALILSELVKAGFPGSIDIEGGHDEVFRGPLEWEGRRFALRHLLSCRA